MRFSQRIGKTPVKEALQLNGIDNDLKTALWNVYLVCFVKPSQGEEHHLKPGTFFIEHNWRGYWDQLWSSFYKRPLDNRSNVHGKTTNRVRDWLFKEARWFEIYDLMEFSAKTPSPCNADRFIELCNSSLL